MCMRLKSLFPSALSFALSSKSVSAMIRLIAFQVTSQTRKTLGEIAEKILKED